MKKISMAILAALALLTAGTAPAQPAATPAQSTVAQVAHDGAFDALVSETLNEMWNLFPDQAVRFGNYKNAGLLMVPDAAQRAREAAFFEQRLRALANIDPKKLSEAKRIDHQIMVSQFESRRWYATTFRGWQWMPSTYNVGNTIGLLLNTQYAPLEARLRHVSARLETIPAYYTAAKANVSQPTLEHTQLGMTQNRGTLRLLGERLSEQVAASMLTPSEKALFTTRLTNAQKVIEDYIAHLGAIEKDLVASPDKARSFRIGRDLYAQKFAHDVRSSFSVTELHQRAIAEKASLHEAMEKRARALWPKVKGNAPMPTDRLQLIRAVIDEVSKQHVKREDFVEAIRKQIPALEKFVREKDLVDQDPTRPLVVRETPLYMRGGGAGASISAPGPFDPTANTYYNVTPLDGMSDADAASYLREYNDWTLQILNIHEAIPGHYTQLMHANKSPSVIKTIFGNGAMIEGWAVFSEKVMLDAGYGNNADEIWLMWMKWNLRSVVNTILDIEIQTMNMSREAAISMMTREAFQEQREANNKWLRATLSQVQLTTYYAGYAEITELRDAIRKQQGGKFSVKGFNNQFLSYGNAPVKSIRAMMLPAGG
jgi:uncharacterized protein (DUF885 family)